MPGANFRRLANVWRQATTDMSVAPFQAVKRAIVSFNHSKMHINNVALLTASKAEGTAAPSFTASLLEELSYMANQPADEEDVIRGAGSSAYAAGSDTVNFLCIAEFFEWDIDLSTFAFF